MYYIYHITPNTIEKVTTPFTSLQEAKREAVRMNIYTCRNAFFPCQEFKNLEELDKLYSLYQICLDRNGRILNKSTSSDLKTEKRLQRYNHLREEIKALRCFLRQLEVTME